MTTQDLANEVTRKKNGFETLLNNRLWLFDKVHIELPTPASSKTGAICIINIPSQPLKDDVGHVRGSLTYGIKDNSLQLIRYGFDFVHAHTFVLFEETERYGGKAFGKVNYSFHYDLDTEKAADFIHPESHLQFLGLSIPRFKIVKIEPELAAFTEMLDMISHTFYSYRDKPGSRTPEISRLHKYMNEYQ